MKTARRQKGKKSLELLTRQELAAALHVIPGTITRWERDGMPVAKRSSRGKPTLFDQSAVETWRAEVEAAKLASGPLSLSDERARLAHTQREKLLMDLAVKRGELIGVDQVLIEGQAYTKVWKAKISALPRRLVQLGLVSREAEPAVAEQIHELLMDIASWKVPGEVAS